MIKCFGLAVLFIDIFLISVEGKSIPDVEDKNITIKAGCTFTVKDLADSQPLLLIPGTEKLLLPTIKSGVISLRQGDKIELFCTTGFKNFSKTELSIVASCNSGVKFSYGLQTINLNRFVCKNDVEHTPRKTKEKCFNNATIVQIGFKVQTRFVVLFDLCHDLKLDHTYYTRYRFTPANEKYQVSVPRPPFEQDIYFTGRNIDKLYTIKVQKKTVAKILGSQERANECIDDKGSDMYMARGHLAAKSDFIFAPHQRATFYFINVAPQWQTFNSKNWERVEDASKSFAASRGINVTVYTGTHGVTTLADGNADDQEIFLDFNPDKAGRVPTPKIYYKILHNEAADAGIVLIGVNNPHLSIEEIEKDYIFCDDISDKIDWIQWDRENIVRGYSYACEVNQFNKVTGHLPQLVIKNLLL